MHLAEAHWSMDVDDVNPGGIFAHLTGPGEDPIETPVLAGKINILFRDEQIRNLEANHSYKMDVSEVPPSGYAKVVLPQRFWVFINDSAATGIDGHDRLGPYEGEAQKDIAGQLVVKFRSQGVFQVLKAGLTYEITIS